MFEVWHTSMSGIGVELDAIIVYEILSDVKQKINIKVSNKINRELRNEIKQP